MAQNLVRSWSETTIQTESAWICDSQGATWKWNMCIVHCGKGSKIKIGSASPRMQYSLIPPNVLCMTSHSCLYNPSVVASTRSTARNLLVLTFYFPFLGWLCRVNVCEFTQLWRLLLSSWWHKYRTLIGASWKPGGRGNDFKKLTPLFNGFL